MNLLKTFLILACAVLAPALFATDITTDITTDTTWNNAGSPYVLKTSLIRVRNGATLTIDSSDGNVEVRFNRSGYDFQVGNGSGDTGFLHIKAVGESIKFRMMQNCNIIVNAYGQVLTTSSTGVTYFENYDPDKEKKRRYDWGAIDFEEDQQYQSSLVNCDITGGGYDGKDGALVVREGQGITPKLEDFTFDDCNVSAIRFDGNGINTLKQDGITLPLSVTNTDYVFYLNAVISTESIRFPDPDTPSAPKAKLAGTATVGDGSVPSHWRFDDGYIFDCVASSKVDVVHGSVWGNEESRPTFQSIDGFPGYWDWVGLEDTNISQANVFGGIGPFAHFTVRDASQGVSYEKYGVTSPITGMTVRLSGITARHCSNGIKAKAKDGQIIIEDATVGGATSSDYCWITGIKAGPGDIVIRDCHVQGMDNGHSIYLQGDTVGYNVRIEDCRVSGLAAQALYLDGAQADSSVVVERSIFSGTITNAVFMYQGPTYSPKRTAIFRHCFFAGSTAGMELRSLSSSEFDVQVEDCTFGGTSSSYGVYGRIVRGAPSMVTLTRCNFSGIGSGAYLQSGVNNLCEYTFDSCLFFNNTYGIRDLRTQTARSVAIRCTFQGNTANGALDSSGGSSATDMLAENCYWGASDGPSGSGPGTGDAVNANVDYSPVVLPEILVFEID